MKKLSLGRIVGIIIVVWTVSFCFIFLFIKDWKISAAFSDSFGIIDSLFSGLALAVIIFTIHLQKNELKLQRKELKYTRKELHRTADAQEKNLIMMNEQLRLSNIPVIEFECKMINEKKFLILKNESQNPAFDVDIWIFQPISSKTIKVSEFKQNFIKEKFIEDVTLKNEIDSFNIADRGVYSTFIRNKTITIPLSYPIEVTYFEIFIQYKDGINNNYCQNIKFKKQNSQLTPFVFSIYNPIIPTVSQRIDLSDNIKNDFDNKIIRVCG